MASIRGECTRSSQLSLFTGGDRIPAVLRDISGRSRVDLGMKLPMRLFWHASCYTQPGYYAPLANRGQIIDSQHQQTKRRTGSETVFARSYRQIPKSAAQNRCREA
jgi:hypothetical protein